MVSVANSSCGAGKHVRVRVKVDSIDIGWVQYGHLDTSIGVGPIGNDTAIGVTKLWPYGSCWQVTSASGVHVHLEAKNTVARSCYSALARGNTYTYGQWIGNLGKPGVSTPKTVCPVGTQPGEPAPPPPPPPPPATLVGGTLADISHDGKADLVGRLSDGTANVYHGTGPDTFDGGTPFGSGWNMFTAINFADINHDGKPDLVGRLASGVPWVYHGTGPDIFDGGTPFGSGWNMFTAIP